MRSPNVSGANGLRRIWHSGNAKLISAHHSFKESMKTSAKKQLPRCSLCQAPLLTAIEKQYKLCTRCRANSLSSADKRKAPKKMPDEPNTVTFATKISDSLAEKAHKRMKERGVSTAAYLRELILKDAA